MVRNRLVLSMTVLTWALVGSDAHADVPPPDDYVESCTRAKQEKDDEYCESRQGSYMDQNGCCDGSSSVTSREDEAAVQTCCAQLAQDGWTYRCKAWGASYYDTLWCRARTSGDPATPSDLTTTTDGDSTKSGCVAAAAQPWSIAAAMSALLVSGAAFWLSRRTRRHDRWRPRA